MGDLYGERVLVSAIQQPIKLLEFVAHITWIGQKHTKLIAANPVAVATGAKDLTYAGGCQYDDLVAGMMSIEIVNSFHLVDVE